MNFGTRFILMYVRGIEAL